MFQLPGETEAQAQERSNGHSNDYSAYRRYLRQSYDFEHAATVYLARVVAKTAPRSSASEHIWPSTRVQPVAALKGKLPTGAQTLTDETWGGMCDSKGDGDGAWGGIGEPVVVFEGLPKSDSDPRGIDSFRARFIRTVEVLDRLRQFGKDLEN